MVKEEIKTYVFRIVVEPDEYRWVAYCPVLKDKGGATWGYTKEEALKNIREVIEMTIESMVEHGEKIPVEPKEEVKVFSEPSVAVTLFNAEGRNKTASEMENHYRYLEPKPYKKTKQLGIKGWNMTVWNLVGTMRTEELSIKETADGFGLPVEAVIEALDYYYKNRTMVEAENEQIGRELGLVKD